MFFFAGCVDVLAEGNVPVKASKKGTVAVVAHVSARSLGLAVHRENGIQLANEST